MFVSVFSIVGIIVLALAVIALAISVAGISSRLKELTDTVMLEPIQGRRGGMDPYDDMYDLPPRRTNNPSMYSPQERRSETRRAPGPQRGSAPQRTVIPQRAQAPQRASVSQRLNEPQRASYSSGYQEIQPTGGYDYPASNVREDPYNSQSFAPVQANPAPMAQSYNSSNFVQNDPYGDDEFFETYRNRDDEGHYLRGRRPTIPFGADKSVVDRRRNSYVGSVADSEYDPDSIDFTRVQGYKRAGGRY